MYERKSRKHPPRRDFSEDDYAGESFRRRGIMLWWGIAGTLAGSGAQWAIAQAYGYVIVHLQVLWTP